MLKFALRRVENTVGKGENPGNQHFLIFRQCFQRPSILGPHKLMIVLCLNIGVILSKDLDKLPAILAWVLLCMIII